MKKTMTALAAGAVFAAALAALPAAAAVRGELKFMSYNIAHCEGQDGKVDLVRTAERIKSEQNCGACPQSS